MNENQFRNAVLDILASYYKNQNKELNNEDVLFVNEDVSFGNIKCNVVLQSERDLKYEFAYDCNNKTIYFIVYQIVDKNSFEVNFGQNEVENLQHENSELKKKLEEHEKHKKEEK